MERPLVMPERRLVRAGRGGGRPVDVFCGLREMAQWAPAAETGQHGEGPSAEESESSSSSMAVPGANGVALGSRTEELPWEAWGDVGSDPAGVVGIISLGKG